MLFMEMFFSHTVLVVLQWLGAADETLLYFMRWEEGIVQSFLGNVMSIVPWAISGCRLFLKGFSRTVCVSGQ